MLISLAASPNSFTFPSADDTMLTASSETFWAWLLFCAISFMVAVISSVAEATTFMLVDDCSAAADTVVMLVLISSEAEATVDDFSLRPVELADILVDMDSTQYHSFAPDMGAYESPFVANLIETNTRLPVKFTINQNYPNPFNPSTKIKYDLPKTEKVKIEVFNLLGQKTKTLLNKQMPKGYHEIEYTSIDLPSGVYLYRIEAGEFHDVKKMILMK